MAVQDTQARAMIRAAEVRAEQTVSLLRMTFAVALLGTLLIAVGHRAEGLSASLIEAQVVFALATLIAYFVLGVISLLVSRSRHYRPWMAWAFVSLDMVFLFANTLSSIQNLGLSGNYIAAFPAVWLVTPLLAYGVLRYDPWLQAFTGAGVLTAVFLAAVIASTFLATAEPSPEHLDRMFDAPPNIIRFTMIAITALVLIVAVLRNRRRLITAIDDARNRAYLTRYLPPRIASWVTGPDAATARAGSHRPMAILFIDIRGFTHLAEGLASDGLARLLTRFRALISATVDAHGGVVDKFIGDGALVAFGVPEPTGHEADDALACGQALLHAVAALSEEPGMPAITVGIGVHYGEVWCGTIGDDHRVEFTVLGDTVNVAARLEQATKEAAQPMLISRSTIDALAEPGRAAVCTAIGPLSLRGREEPVEAFGIAASA